jgi:hypothetical protein
MVSRRLGTLSDNRRRRRGRTPSSSTEASSDSREIDAFHRSVLSGDTDASAGAALTVTLLHLQ